MTPSYQSHSNILFASAGSGRMLTSAPRDIVGGGGCWLQKGADVSQCSLTSVKECAPNSSGILASNRSFQYTNHSHHHPKDTGVPLILSHCTHAWLPRLANPVHLVNKPFTRNLRPLNTPLSNSHGRMFIRHIEWILQQPYIRCLQRLESLLHPTNQHIDPH